MEEHIHCELENAILTVTLNRPDKLNAYTAQMGRELAAAFDRADRDDAVRVVIVTGAGRAFCAGADISGGATAFGAGASVMFGDQKPSQSEPNFVDSIYRCRKPSIAAINGAAVGVGITLTLPMDIRLAATGARVGFVFARRGLVPEAGSAWFLPRLVGLQQALRWCYSGRLLDAQEVLRRGRQARMGGKAAVMVDPDAARMRQHPVARRERRVVGGDHRAREVDAADPRKVADHLAGGSGGQRILVVQAGKGHLHHHIAGAQVGHRQVGQPGRHLALLGGDPQAANRSSQAGFIDAHRF